MTQSNILFIGMDVHKDSIVISLADDNRTDIRRYGSIGVKLKGSKIKGASNPVVSVNVVVFSSVR